MVCKAARSSDSALVRRCCAVATVDPEHVEFALSGNYHSVVGSMPGTPAITFPLRQGCLQAAPFAQSSRVTASSPTYHRSFCVRPTLPHRQRALSRDPSQLGIFMARMALDECVTPSVVQIAPILLRFGQIDGRRRVISTRIGKTAQPIQRMGRFKFITHRPADLQTPFIDRVRSQPISVRKIVCQSYTKEKRA